MPATKAYSPFWSTATAVPAGTTKANPVISNVVDGRTGYGGELVFSITNSGALNAPCTIMFQTSPDNSAWYDYQAVFSSDLLSGTVTPGPSAAASRGGMYWRAIAYGNTNSACQVIGGFEQVTAL